jgi:CheY-like chemotaxis protein
MPSSKEYTGPIHLLATDLLMPRMGGRQLAQLLSAARPEMRVLFITGYTEENVLQIDAPASVRGLLHKPFTPMSLARKAREILDAKE